MSNCPAALAAVIATALLATAMLLTTTGALAADHMAGPGPASTAAAAGAEAAAEAAAASPPPSGCPDLTDGRVPFETIIALGADRMIACLAAAEVPHVTFDAYFTPRACAGCGGSRSAFISPSWLSGGLVEVDAKTGAISPSQGISRYGMSVATGPRPTFADAAAEAAWTAANVLDLRLPPTIGTCMTDDTTSASGCSVARYAGQVLRFTARYGDPASATCTGTVVDGPPLPTPSAIAYCRQQLVVQAFVVTEPYVCPTAPYTVLELSHFATDRLVACLGDRTIAVTGLVPAPVVSPTERRWVGGPAWLVDDGSAGMVLASGTITEDAALAWLKVRIPPKLGACATVATDPASCPFRPFVGKWVRIVGHFADPVSAKCVARWAGPGAAPAWFTADAVRQYCREQFVLSAKPKPVTAPKAP